MGGAIAGKLEGSNDYPHAASTWPKSREVVARDFVGVSAEDRRKIVFDNVARLYNFQLAEADLAATAGTTA